MTTASSQPYILAPSPFSGLSLCYALASGADAGGAGVDLHVDGKIEGDLKCANLVQGEASEIKGAVTAETAKIAGLLDGSIEAKTLIVHATARITGDVTYETITIENGGKVDGKLSHRRHGAGAAKAPPPLEVVENKSALGI